MTINAQTDEHNEIEEGDYINRNNVAHWDADNTDQRYKALNTSPRQTLAGQEGYILQDRETDAIHIANLDNNLSQPDYRINATNVSLTIDGEDVTNNIIDDLTRGVQYDHRINKDTVRIEYAGESGWPEEAGDDDWDVITTVTSG